MSDLTPPPSRPAPDALRRRIDRELQVAESRTLGPRHVIAPIAAVGLLVAGVLGATQLSAQREVLPARTPSAPASAGQAQTPSATPVPTRSPSPTGPTKISSRAMTAKEVAADTASCTAAPTGPGAEPIPHQGRWRVLYALATPAVSYPVDAAFRRVMVVYDEVGTYVCLDGDADSWSSGTPERRDPTVASPARALDQAVGSGASCGGTAGTDGRLSAGTAYRVSDRVTTARVTLRSAGTAVRVVDITPRDGWVAVPVLVTGRAAWAASSYAVQLLDHAGHALPIDDGTGAKASPTHTVTVADCGTIDRDRQAHAPKPIKRPTSDAAGDASCRAMIAEHVDGSGGSFDAAAATVGARVSTATEWGVVLTDGEHYVGCSLFPTREISPVRTVAAGTSDGSFGWALNPITPAGESLWAAGYLPGATRISYRLPDGSSVDATIGSTGYWLVKTHTTTAFDTEERVDDWAPIRVTVTRDQTTTTHTIAWSEATMCQQVSHGC